MMRRILAAGALVALALSACTKVGDTGSQTQAAPAQHADRLVIGTIADPKNLNPALASATPVLELSAFLYSYTVRYDEHSQPVPDAVSEVPTVANGDVAKDGLTIRYKLRHGIKWHDGKGDLTCADMRFTWHVMMNPKNNVITTDGWKDIKDVDCTDPYVAVVHMKRVYAPYLQQLWSLNGNGPILPEHVLAKYNDDKGSFNTAPFNAAPIASGPYKFVAWQRGSEVRLEVNPDYYLGKPAINEIVYRIIPDGNTMVTQLRTGELDFGWGLPAAQVDGVRKIPNYTTITPVVYLWDHIDFNLKRPLFADVRVRRALTYAIDRTALLDKVEHGLGELSDTFLDRGLHPDAVDDAVMKYPYDAARAKALLDEAGWKPGPDGVRVKNGTRLAFTIGATAESTTAHAIQSLVQSYWHAVGADAEVKNSPSSLFFDNTANGILQGGKYDVAIFAWSAAADIDQSAIYSAHYLAPHGQNALFWTNATATKAMDDANATVDQAKRIADYKVVQREFAQDDPSIILWFRKFGVAYRSDLKGFTPTPVITTPFWNTWAFHY